MAQFSRIYNYSFKKKIFFFTSSLYSFSNPHPVSSSPPWDPIHPCAAVRPSNENAAFPRTLTLAAGAKRVVSWRWKRHVASIHRETVHHLNVRGSRPEIYFFFSFFSALGRSIKLEDEYESDTNLFIYFRSIEEKASDLFKRNIRFSFTRGTRYVRRC